MIRGKQRVVLAITGASGAVYSVRLLDILLNAGCEVHLSISPAGAAVIKQELDLSVPLEENLFCLENLLPTDGNAAGDARYQTLRTLLPQRFGGGTSSRRILKTALQYFHYSNLMAPMASGSSLTAGMVICPCSGGTLSSIANAASGNLIQRAADVHLKERRKLILVPRETPLSMPQLENMRRCAEYGAVVLPAMPGFYHGARSLEDLVNFVVARICDHLSVEHELMLRWGERKAE